jgi:hypothetical protein
MKALSFVISCPVEGKAGLLISRGAWFRSGGQEQYSAKQENGFMQTNVILLGKGDEQGKPPNQPFVFH